MLMFQFQAVRRWMISWLIVAGDNVPPFTPLTLARRSMYCCSSAVFVRPEIRNSQGNPDQRLCYGRGFVGSRQSRFRRLAIVLQKEHNIVFRRDGQQSLPDTHEEVIDLVRFGLGFVRFDFADRKGVTFPMVEKLAVPAFAFLRKGCHASTFSAILLQALATHRPRHRNANPEIQYCKSFENKDLRRKMNAAT
jgi:hypothetical protein